MIWTWSEHDPNMYELLRRIRAKKKRTAKYAINWMLSLAAVRNIRPSIEGVCIQNQHDGNNTCKVPLPVCRKKNELKREHILQYSRTGGREKSSQWIGRVWRHWSEQHVLTTTCVNYCRQLALKKRTEKHAINYRQSVAALTNIHARRLKASVDRTNTTWATCINCYLQLTTKRDVPVKLHASRLILCPIASNSSPDSPRIA